MHFALEELQSHDGVDGDQQKDQQSNVQQRQHGFEDGVHHHLQAWELTVKQNQSKSSKSNSAKLPSHFFAVFFLMTEKALTGDSRDKA